MIDLKHQLRARSGPHYDRWRRRSLAKLGIVIPLDDTPEQV